MTCVLPDHCNDEKLIEISVSDYALRYEIVWDGLSENE